MAAKMSTLGPKLYYPQCLRSAQGRFPFASACRDRDQGTDGRNLMDIWQPPGRDRDLGQRTGQEDRAHGRGDLDMQ